jgi:uncharacterized protein (TIGR02145 family)/uncharacterized repeat protein (TIGR02543 family)
MKHTLHLSASLIGIIITIFLFCIELPQDPAEDPNNSEASIFIDKNLILHHGDSPVIGLSLSLTRHFQSITVTTSCGVFNSSIAADTLSDYDTVYFRPQFNSVGPCSVFVSAQFRDLKLKDKNDTLLLYILAAEPGIHFITTPPHIKTGIGKTDTLLYVTKSTGEVTLPPTYSIITEPQEGITITPYYSQLKDTLRIAISSIVVNTYKLKAVVSVNYNNLQLKDSVITEVQVSESGVLVPSKVDLPKTIPIGIADTLLFAIDNSNSGDKLSIKLVNEPPLDPAVFTTLPTGTDSILIKVLSTQAGTANVGISVTNGSRIDTTWYSITIGTINTSLWNKNEVALTAIEGKAAKLDLRQYLVGTQSGSVALSANVGIVNDTFWEWTPPFGAEASVLASITAVKDTLSSILKLTITVSPGDSIKPSISLVDQTLNGKKVGSSNISVECVASDRESGIGNVKFSFGSSSIDAMWQHDSIYTGIITGLKNGMSTEITVTATDKSMKKNSKLLVFTVTYDSTMVDEEKPIIAYLSGPKSGERVKDSSGIIVFSITDNSGIDSVWWTLNGINAGMIAKTADSKYSVDYALKKYGKNSIIIYARDGSGKKNIGKTEINLTYNTTPSAVVSGEPVNKSVNASTEPTMTWTGGVDSDSDTVYYKVSYGTAENNLVTQSAETKEHSFSVLAPNKLSANSIYYWQIIAYTKQPYIDTVKSEIVSFTTSGNGPSITSNLPASMKVIEGSTLSLKVVADGTPSPTFKWYKNDLLQTGQTGAEFNKNNVAAGDSGVYYVIVNNGIGTGVISTKTVVTIRLKAAITQDPVATTVNEGGNGTFTVRAIGEEPLSFQWLKDGSPLSGETSATYSVTGANVSDNGKNISCIVSNSLGKDTSVAALLTVTSKPVYKVIFNAGAGVTGPDDQQIVEGGKVTQPSPPTRNGYDFSGWYKESSYTNAWVFTIDVVTGPVTLYAKWAAKSNSITYILNGGINHVSNPTSYTVTSAAITLAAPSRTGYTFGGWFENSSLNGTAITTIPSGSTGDKIVWAKWTVDGYTITYNLNGGTNHASNPTSYTIVSTALTLAVPSRIGYTFGGWYDNSGFSGTAVTTIPSGSTGDKAFWAKWTADGYTITYNLNGGANHASNPTSYNVTTSTITLAAPNRAGYTFGGWYDNSGLSGSAVTTVPSGSTGDKAFWAKWTADGYTITYNLNGGANHASNPTSYNIATSTITLAAPNRAGYTFGGWYDNSGLSGSAVTTIPSGSTGDKAFWAKWTADGYTITYNLNGGTNHASNPTSYNVTTSTITLAAPNRAGYAFGGWYDNSGLSGSAVTTIPSGSTGDRAFWAKWTLSEYTITYNNLTGATNNPTNPSKYSMGAAITLYPATKSAYVFDGWYTDPGFAPTSKTSTIVEGSTGDKVFYAKWVIKDLSGNEYHEVKIGSQVWMVENLKTTKLKNGDNLVIGTHFSYVDGSSANTSNYGLLYPWNVVSDSRGLAPEGWHIPSYEEWQTLVNYVTTNAGGNVAVLMSNNSVWNPAPSPNANSLGFSAYPAGTTDGSETIGLISKWWSSTDRQPTWRQPMAASIYITQGFESGYLIDNVGGDYYEKGLSVRCIRDY